jgi:hypothetical protein
MVALRQNVFRALLSAATIGVALAAALQWAPPAGAVPACTDIGPFTRICETPGHSAIITTPNPAFSNPWPGWGFGGVGMPAFGLGGGGIWLGY